jgi:hypothetical protein
MSTKPIKPRLADRLCSLAESQLQIQAARSAALDGGSLGVMAVDAAIGAIAVDTSGAYDLWVLALILLGLSLSLAVRVLRIPGAERTGPVIEDIYGARETQDDSELERPIPRSETRRVLSKEWWAAPERAPTLAFLAKNQGVEREREREIRQRC